MMLFKFKKLYFSLVISTVILACNKQELNIEITDKACEKIELSQITYTWLSDPSPDSESTTIGQIEFNFTFDGEERCVDIVNFAAKAFDCNGKEIKMGYAASVQKSSSKLTVTGNKVKAIYDITFEDAATANALNHIILTLKTQNDLGDKSKELEIRVNATDNVVKPNSYVVNDDVKTVAFADPFFNITLWDYAAEDGDIVSVYLNGEWVIENFSLLNAKTIFSISRSKLNLGTNHLIVFAQNEGSVGANTASIAINGSEVKNFKPGLTTGEAVQVKVN